MSIEQKKFEQLLVSVEEQIAVITINNPPANSLGTKALTELKEVIDEIETRTDIKVVIVTGAGNKFFVAGADIKEMVSATPLEGRQMADLAHYNFAKLESLPQVVIAAVNGFALGGGCELSMGADFRYAAENAQFGQPEVNLGTIPGWGGTQRLPRLVGKGRAKELIYTADFISAQRAYEIGLVNKVVPVENLLEEAKKTAKKIITKGSVAVSFAKLAVNTGLDVDLASGCKYERDLFALTFATEDKKIGMEAFVNKAKAEFKGK
jgi:enoyl-CoA hydratase